MESPLSISLPAMYVDFINKVSPSYGRTTTSTIIFAVTKYLLDHPMESTNVPRSGRTQVRIPKKLKDKIMDRIPHDSNTQSQMIFTALDYLRFYKELFGKDRVYHSKYFVDFTEQISIEIKIIDFIDNYTERGTVLNILGETYIDVDKDPVRVELECPIELYAELLSIKIEVGKKYTITYNGQKFMVV